MAYEILKDLVNRQEWGLADRELAKFVNGEWDDELAILACTVCMAEGNLAGAYICIGRGLLYNYRNYELYLMLGNYYETKNINQAWLCYENAEYYCDNADDLEIIRQYKRRIEQMEEWNVRKTSIVILTYNTKEICIQCIESVRKNNPASAYELVIVDNASWDGITEWLKEQTDITLICNAENKGFPYGCNQGIEAAGPDNDILLLNSDTVVMPNSVFWLRMGLYEAENVGASGSVTNMAGNGQRVDEEYGTLEEYIAYAKKKNVPIWNPFEKKVWLVGFAMLIKRQALDKVGLLDDAFSPGGEEDVDFSVRLQYAGYRLLLCWNSFIFHYGHGGGNNRHIWEASQKRTKERFKAKWKFDMKYYTYCRIDLLNLIDTPWEEKMSVLEVGCGCGATLGKIEYFWSNAAVKGIELNENVARVGANYLDIIQGNIETMELPYEKETFDYIILGDVLEHLYDPQKTLERLLPYLKPEGRFLCSVPNVMNKSVVCGLLRGKFEYADAGILDRTHLRFFTLDSIVELFEGLGMRISKLNANYDGEEMDTPEDRELLEGLCQLPHVADRGNFFVYQWVFAAERLNS